MSENRSITDIRAEIKERYDLIWCRLFKGLDGQGFITKRNKNVDLARARVERIERNYERKHGRSIDFAACMPKLNGEINALFWMLGRKWDAAENTSAFEIISFYEQEVQTETETEVNISWIFPEGDSLIMLGKDSDILTVDMFPLEKDDNSKCETCI